MFALLGLLLCNLIWSMNFSVSKVVMDGRWASMSPLALSFWRLVLASLVLVPLAWRERPRRPLTGREWGSLAIVGVFGTAMAVALLFYGTYYSLATNAALITALETVFTVLIAAAFLGEKLDLRTVGALVMAFIGVMLLSDIDWQKLDLFSGQYAFGNALLVIAMIGYGIYTPAAKVASATLHPMVITGYPFLIATAVLGLFALIVEPSALTSVTTFGWKAWGGLTFLALIGTAATFLLWNKVVVRASVTMMGMTLYVQPVFGALLAWMFLDERLSAKAAAGAVAIFLAVVLVAVRRPAAEKVEEVGDELAGVATGR